MKAKIYRNLDRPFSMFGIKGRYLAVGAGGLLTDLLLSLFTGSLLGTFWGLACALVLAVGLYLTLLEVQRAVPPGELGRKVSGLLGPKFIIIRHKPWKK